MPFGSVRSKTLSFGSRPRLLVGTAFGTLFTYVLFVRHYMSIHDDTETWVWFGIRSDGRCGRDFSHDGWNSGDTMCGKGQCCSSHGWCGHGEEYCSVSMGCQSGCYAATEEDVAKAKEKEKNAHIEAPEEDAYADRMHNYRYDDDNDVPDNDYYRRKYGGSGGHHRYRDDHAEEYHHQYDANSDELPDHHAAHHGDAHHDEPEEDGGGEPYDGGGMHEGGGHHAGGHHEGGEHHEHFHDGTDSDFPAHYDTDANAHPPSHEDAHHESAHEVGVPDSGGAAPAGDAEVEINK